MQMCMPAGPCPAKIMIVAEAPGPEEIRQNMPLVGTVGREFDRMLVEAGIARSLCFVTHVGRVIPPGEDAAAWIAVKKKDITPNHIWINDKPCLQPIRQGMELLTQEINMCQPSLIISVGNISLFALTGKFGIMSWRGSLLECTLPHSLQRPVKVIPVINPKMILRRFDWRPIAIHDLRRCKKESLSSEIIRPNYKFIIRPNFDTALYHLSTFREHLDQSEIPQYFACDIETRRGHIACLGLAWNKLDAICIPFMCVEDDSGYWTAEEEFQIVLLLREILTHPNARVIGQNFHYDALQVL